MHMQVSVAMLRLLNSQRWRTYELRCEGGAEGGRRKKLGISNTLGFCFGEGRAPILFFSFVLERVGPQYPEPQPGGPRPRARAAVFVGTGPLERLQVHGHARSGRRWCFGSSQVP